MDRPSGRRSREDSSLRKASRERLCAAFSKRGASGRDDELVRKIPNAVSIPKEVRGIGHEGRDDSIYVDAPVTTRQRPGFRPNPTVSCRSSLWRSADTLANRARGKLGN